MTPKKKSIETQDKQNLLFTQQQDKFYQTGDPALLWQCWDNVCEFFSSYLKKLQKNNKIHNIDEKVLDCQTYLYEQIIQNKKKINSLTQYGHWVSMNILYNKNTVFSEKSFKSFEDYKDIGVDEYGEIILEKEKKE